MFWLLFLRADLTAASWQNLIESNSTIPAVLFCFADWCPHCRRAHPDWVKFAKANEDRQDILIGTVNCSQEDDLCRNILRIGYFPTFLTFFQNKTKVVRLNSVPETYPRVIDRLLMQQNGTFVPTVDRPPTQFPTIAFDVNTTDEEGKQLAYDVAVDSTYFHVIHFQYNTTNDSGRRARAYIDSDCVVEFDRTWSRSNLTEFVSEYGHKLLGEDWLMWTVRSLRRKFVMVISDDQTQLKEIRALAKEFRNDLAFGIMQGKLKSSAMKFTKSRRSECPLVIVSDLRNGKFAKISKATDMQKVKDLLSQVKNNSTDLVWDTMDLRSDIELIWEVAVTTGKIVVAVLLGGVALGLIGVFIWYIRRRVTAAVPKID